MKKAIQILMLSIIMVLGIFVNNVFAGTHVGATVGTGDIMWDAQATINTPFYPITYWPSWSMNYTMIRTVSGDSWAQVGWVKEYNNFYNNGQTLNGTYYYFQYYDPSMGSDLYTVFSTVGPATSSSHTYLTLLDQTNTYYGTVDNATIGSHPAGFNGTMTEYEGEVSSDSLARFTGSSSNALYMWSIYYAYMSGGTKYWVLSPYLDFNSESQYGKYYTGS